MTEKLTGHIERVTFSSPETGYTVAKVKVRGRRELVPAVGTMSSIRTGETVELEGEWETHPKYGPQFKVQRYSAVEPAGREGIQKYLASGAIKGIGPAMAQRLVDRFGADTLEVIEHRTERLMEVEGIGRKRVDMIRRAWDEQQELRRLMLFLQEHDVSPTMGMRIHRAYGDRALDLVRENPYLLARDVKGIGFATADRIARKLGFPPESPLRADAGLSHVLLELAGSEGHVFAPYETLLEKCGHELGIDRDLVARAAGRAVAESRVVIEDLDNGGEDYRVNHKAVFLAGLHRSEVETARRLAVLMNEPRSIRTFDPDKAAEWVQARLGVVLSAGQVDAVGRAATGKVLVITGGPGTGKTTIVRSILAVYEKAGAVVLLAAPTGRAAKRMAETTGRPAKTIHRLLEYQPNGFNKNERNPLEAELIVIDEASMIDVNLTHHLLKAVPPGAVLVLVGDVDQLPSVGPGNVLGDVIDSGAVPVVRLTEIFRQAQDSAIIVNAHRINQGRPPLPPPEDGRLTDFYFIDKKDPEEAAQTIIELAVHRIPDRFGFHPVDQIQVITPMHRGHTGTVRLNQALQAELNPGASNPHPRLFRTGDKVMQVRNDYDKDVYNGDIGRVVQVDPEAGRIAVRFDDRAAEYDAAELEDLTLAYAVSVHKSQGSEYPAVVLPLLTEHYLLLRRNLLYTAVTRGKNLVLVVGDPKALHIALQENHAARRHTRLAERLADYRRPAGT